MALVATADPIRRPMSWHDFLEPSDGERAECSERVAVSTPPPTETAKGRSSPASVPR